MIAYKTWLYPILLLTALTLGACGGGGSSAPAVDETPPVFSSMVPADKAIDVKVDTDIIMTFNEHLKNCDADTVTLDPPVDGVVTCFEAKLTFAPFADLQPDQEYTVTVRDVADSAGNSLTTPVVKRFKTAAVDTKAPEVVSTQPVNNTNFVTPQSTISAVFNESILSSTFPTNFILTGPAGAVAGAVIYTAATKIATFTPSAPLAAGVYDAALTTGITDLAGNALASEYTWSFEVVSAPAFIAAPAFSSVYAKSGVPVELTLQVTPNAYNIIVCLDRKPSSSPTPTKLAVATVDTNDCNSPAIINSTGASEIKLTVNTTFDGIFYPRVQMIEDGTETPLITLYEINLANSSAYYTASVSGTADDVVTSMVVPFLVVGAAPDLQATITSATLSVSGTTLTIAYSVKNHGDKDAVAATTLDFFVDAVTAPVVGQNGGVQVDIPALDIDETYTSTIDVSVSAAPSLVYALVDSTDVVVESDESNNVATWVNVDAPKETFSNTDGQQDIPSPGSLSSTLQVASVIDSLRYVAVELDITHPFDDDLTLTLISPPVPGFPNGKSVILSNKRGGEGRNYSGTLFHDGAAIAIAAGTPPFNGTFIPDAPLAVLNGENPDGLWTLKVEDSNTFDLGTLNSWSLRLW